jgi:hypothetical protein
MEVLIGIIVIIVLCKILGVSNFVLILCGLGIIELIIIAMLLFFIYSTFHLFLTKKCSANFTRIDTPEKGKFKVAFYEIEGEEYPCVFPHEAGFSTVYRTDKVYKVRYSKYLKKVFDIWATLTCFVGLIFSIITVAVTFGIIKNFGSIL